MKRNIRRVLLAVLMLAAVMQAGGCLVTQSQDTPVEPLKLSEVQTGRDYWLYVPSYYSPQQRWPLVITLHGTHYLDGAQRQISEWKALAEQKGFIVAAPSLKSTQGVLPVIDSLWMKHLAADEQTVLAVQDEVCRRYNIHPKGTMLSGFSAGGYPMYYVGLRNPARFRMLVARGCNSDQDIFDAIELSDAARAMDIAIFWGKDDMKHIQKQSWAAYRWLRENRCFKTTMKEVKGGHLRRPEVAWQLWIDTTHIGQP